jgi:hypothetical protein
MIDFDKYKSQISLPDFLKDVYGFKKDEGSSQNYPKLKCNETGEVFVVKKNHKGHYTYFDIHNDNIKGKTILDYVQKRLSIEKFGHEGKLVSLPDVAKYLDNYIKTGKFVSPENSSFILNNESLSKDYITKVLLELKPFQEPSFLSNRGITEETFNGNLFKGVIFNKDFYDEETKTMHINTVFKMWSQEGVIAISQRNESFKGCLGSKSESICISNFDNTRPIDLFYIGESFIDCMSHYQLNSQKLSGKNVVYVSSEGNLVDGQINVIQKAVNINRPLEIGLIFDNDLAGHYYSAKFLGKLDFENQSLGESTRSSFPNSDLKGLNIEVLKGTSISHLEIYLLNDIHSETNKKTIETIISDENLKLKSYFGEDQFKVKALYENGNFKKFDISFENSFETWSAAAEAILKIKFNGIDNIKREIPLLNDFNDDLRILSGKHPSYKFLNTDAGIEIQFKDKSLGPVPKEYIEKYNIPSKSTIQKNNHLEL